MARALFKGQLALGKLELPVKMYAAVEDRDVHFRLLDKATRSPVRQRIVRKADGKEVPKQEQRKAFPIDADRAVMLTEEELDSLEPESSRDIRLLRFVASDLLGDAWYDRPYYLGPDGDATAYFALAQALAGRKTLGIARWVMRRKRYVGALHEMDGYLGMVTLRRAEQVLSIPSFEPAKKADAKELGLARQLVEAISAEFDPSLWQDEYHERVCRLIEAKAKGKRMRLPSRKPKRAAGGLAAQLRRSLSSMQEGKRA